MRRNSFHLSAYEYELFKDMLKKLKIVRTHRRYLIPALAQSIAGIIHQVKMKRIQRDLLAV